MKCSTIFIWGVCVFNTVFGAFPPVFPDLNSTLNQFPGSKCKDHFTAYLSALNNYTLWAVQMYDSSVQYPTGVISGNVYQLGNFDQCLKVKVDLSEESEKEINKRNVLLKGQYCLLYVKINPPRKFHPRLARYSLDYDPKASFWVRMQDNHDKTQYKRNIIHWAICIPDSCSPSLLQMFLDKYLVHLQPEYYVSALVKPELCQSAEKHDFLKKFSVLDIMVTLLFIFLIFFVILSTIADLLISYKKSYVTDFNQVNIENFGLLGQILSCFSVKQNVALLMQTNFSNSGFDCIVGLRLLFMILVISGHRFLVVFNGPIFDTTAAEEGYRKPYNMFILNGMIVVDTFFVYSGLLTAYYLLLEMDDKKTLNPFIIWLYRFIRLTPVYLVVLLYYSTLLNHFGSGPLWPTKVGIESQRCANYWWTNIFYINNYVYTSEMCMFQSWYLSVDTHLFMVTVLIVYTVWKWSTLGYIILCFSFFLSVFMPFYFTYTTSSAAFLMLYPNVIEDLPSSKYFQKMFVATHMRAGPYMVGVITGILLYKLRATPIKISQKFVYTGHICCILLCLGAQFSGYIFYEPNVMHHPFVTGLYASLHRIVWGVSVAINIFLLVHGRIEWLYKILTWTPLVPISRLSYCAYLVHTITHLYEAGTARHSNTLSYYTGIWMFIGDIVSTFIISLLLCLTVEAPCRSLEKLFFRTRKTEIQNDKRNTQ